MSAWLSAYPPARLPRSSEVAAEVRLDVGREGRREKGRKR